MSDFTRLRNATAIINQGNLDKAWAALHWVFCSTDLEPDGFYQTMSRFGIDAERYKRDLLDRSEIARAFYYGVDDTPEENEDTTDAPFHR